MDKSQLRQLHLADQAAGAARSMVESPPYDALVAYLTVISGLHSGVDAEDVDAVNIMREVLALIEEDYEQRNWMAQLMVGSTMMAVVQELLKRDAQGESDGSED